MDGCCILMGAKKHILLLTNYIYSREINLTTLDINYPISSLDPTRRSAKILIGNTSRSSSSQLLLTFQNTPPSFNPIAGQGGLSEALVKSQRRWV